MQFTQESRTEHQHGIDNDQNDSSVDHDISRASSMIESNAIGAKDNLKELVAIMGDALALKKNIVLARYFDKLDADKLRSFAQNSSNAADGRMSVDVWVTASDTANPEWDAMEGDLSLQVQLAYCLLAGRKTAWHKYTYIRVVVVAVVGSGASLEEIEKEKESCRLRTELMLREIRVPAQLCVVCGVASAPTSPQQTQMQTQSRPGEVVQTHLGSVGGSLPPPMLGLNEL